MVSLKESSKSCISHVFQRMGLDPNRCPGGSLCCGHTSARCCGHPSVAALSYRMLYHTWAFALDLCDALENFYGRGVSCLISLPHGGSYRITLFGTSHPFPMRRRSLLFQYNMGSTTARRVCPCLALCWGERERREDGSAPAKGRG